MISPIFVFLVPFAFVSLSYIECYRCSSEVLRTRPSPFKNIDGRIIDQIRKYGWNNYSKRNPANEKPRVNDFLTIPGKQVPNGTVVKKSDIDENNFHGLTNYGFYPMPPEEPETLKEEANRDDAVDDDYFKRKMANELYLELWKHLDRMDDQDK